MFNADTKHSGVSSDGKDVGIGCAADPPYQGPRTDTCLVLWTTLLPLTHSFDLILKQPQGSVTQHLKRLSESASFDMTSLSVKMGTHFATRDNVFVIRHL